MGWPTLKFIKRLGTACVLALALAVAALPSPANEPVKAKSKSAYTKLTEQKFYRLKHAKVAWVDFDLMRADFPELRKLSDAEIEGWILDQFGFISEMQLKLRGLRVSDFEVTEESRIFYHPTNYDRAAVAPAELGGKSIGMIDLKGDGLSNEKKLAPQLKEAAELTAAGKDLTGLYTQGHDDGVASLGEAISEVTKQRAIQAGYDLGYAKGQTVEHYFIIDSGFDIFKPGGKIPAAIIGRQPCIVGNNFKGTEAIKLYSDDHGGFQRSITGSTRDYGGHIIQIDELKIKFAVLPGGDPKNPQASRSWAEGHDTAVRFRSKAESNIFEARGEIYKHLDTMLVPLGSRWKKVRSLGEVPLDTQVSELMAAFLDVPNFIPERAALLRELGAQNHPKIFEVLENYYLTKSDQELDREIRTINVATFISELEGPGSARLQKFFENHVFKDIVNFRVSPVYFIHLMKGLRLPEDPDLLEKIVLGGVRLREDGYESFIDLIIHHPHLRDPNILRIIETNAVRSPFSDLIERAGFDTPRIRTLLELNRTYPDRGQVKRFSRVLNVARRSAR